MVARIIETCAKNRLLVLLALLSRFAWKPLLALLDNAAEAIEFYKRAFRAEERSRLVDPESGTPSSSTRNTRSASPSKASPTSAPISTTRR